MIDQIMRDEAVRLRKTGLTIARIVDQLGISQKSVCDIMKEAGLATKKHKPSRVKRAAADGRSVHPDVIEDIKRMYQAGKTVQHICDVTGVSDQTIRRHLRLAGLRQPRKRVKKQSSEQRTAQKFESQVSGDQTSFAKRVRSYAVRYGYFGVEEGLHGGFVVHIGDASSIELPTVTEALQTAQQTLGEDTGSPYASGE